jgi:sugar-specific transcriptional regulator TrmB
MSQESMLKSLMNLGLTKPEAKVYFYLAKKGPKKANEITKELKMKRQQLYPIIRTLQSRLIVTATLDRPAKFSAIAFERFLDLFARVKFEEAKTIQLNKGKLLSDWQSINPTLPKDNSSLFTVINGKKYVYSKIQQMIQETQSQISVISDLTGLFRAEQFGVFDVIKSHPRKNEIQFKIITEIPRNYLQAVKDLMKTINPEIKIKGRNADIGLSLFPKMVIRDNAEILYFISTTADELNEKGNEDALFTNCNSLVKPLSRVFENLWKNSTAIEQKILEIETGTLPQRTIIIEEFELATAKCDKALREAKESIIMATSSEQILQYWKNPSLLKELTKKGVSIKIMAPVSRKNLTACLDLLEFCEIRHVPNEYVKTIIIDRNHLFQFKIIDSREKGNSIQNISQTLYSSDFEYINKTKKMLLDIWKNSVIPSSLTMEATIEQLSTSGPPFKRKAKYKFIDKVYTTHHLHDKTDKTRINEQDVIRKILNYKKNPVTKANNTICGFAGHSLIHFQEAFESALYIAAYHIDEESSYGAEDALIVMAWLSTPKGFSYVPVAIVGNNPKASQSWKRLFKDPFAPASKNYYLFKKDEIQIQMHGDTFFAGWTKSIPILPNQSLPPSAIILEATGIIRSRAFETTFPNGVKLDSQFNYYDAFVTMINKKIKYQGPATDGLFIREMYQDEILP